MDRIPEKIDSKFRFVLLAAERAEQMLRGARPKIDMGPLKATRIAMQEISNDLVEWDYGPAPETDVEYVEEEVAAESEEGE
ncbi:MAG: DNA-directed RNA polymerase subunit omega [Acidobacteriota bacterium]